MKPYQQLTIKDHFRETNLFNTRLIVAAIIATSMFLIIVSRLFYLQVLNHQHYVTLSEGNRLSIRPIAPIRGLIYDRNGVLLAQNTPTFTLEIIPERSQDIEQTIAAIRKVIMLSDSDIERFQQQRKNKRRFDGIPLRFRLSDNEVARLSVIQDKYPSIDIKAELTRHYPLGKLAAHAIGYVGRINEQELQKLDASRYSATKYIGKVGVERSYEDLLHGEVGFERVEIDAQGRAISSLEQTLPEPGKNLYLNIDVKLQEIAEKGFVDHNGALVAIDPNTGAILALVSVPTYDPNLFVNGIDTKSYKELSQSPDRPLFNRAIQGQYPPGSTIKPFMGLAGLELNMITAETSLNCPGWYMLKNDDRRYRDWKRHGHSHTDLHKAIVESCDVFFYDLALALKIRRIHPFMFRFGLGHRTGIDIRGEADGLMPSAEWKKKRHRLPWFPGETLITGIGQGFTLATPVQLAHMTATLGTAGKRLQPRVVYAYEDGNELVVQPPKSLEPVTQANPAHWQSVIDAMIDVVHGTHGTARGISRNLKYKIAGKTGTAQVFGIKEDEEYDETKIAKKLRDHALFIAFAPADKPRIAVAVIVENGGHGGSAAAPIVRKVMDAYLVEEKE